jgi:DNA-binding PucR family transcriptional regulator
MMFDAQDEEQILRLAGASVSLCGSCRVAASYLVRHGVMTPRPVDGRWPAREVDTQVAGLDAGEAAVALNDRRWGWAFALRGLSRLLGYLIVEAPAAPSDQNFFLVKLVAQQAAGALVNVTLQRQERQQARQLRVLDRERTSAKTRLSAAVSDLQRQTTIHQTLARASASGGGQEGIAQALHDLTALPVVVEDRFGNVRVWVGPKGAPAARPKPAARKREEVLQRAARRGQPLRDGDRVMVLARPGNEVLGVLALVDPNHRAGQHEILALEQAATVLALELDHRRDLAQMELRLHRNLVADLITGTDEESAVARSDAAGHDLHGPNYVAVLQWRDRPADDSFAEQVRRAAATTGTRPLLARHSGTVVLLVGGEPDWQSLFAAVSRQTGTSCGAIGVSGGRVCPAELPRCFQEALRALEIRQKSSPPTGVTGFDGLGIYRVLGASDEEIASFVREWLGSLLDYDARHHGDLVSTLSEYLDRGGNYDRTAGALVIHRSTLRYRLRRIREITGLDLQDADSRLNLHVATRACKVLRRLTVPWRRDGCTHAAGWRGGRAGTGGHGSATTPRMASMRAGDWGEPARRSGACGAARGAGISVSPLQHRGSVETDRRPGLDTPDLARALRGGRAGAQSRWTSAVLA